VLKASLCTDCLCSRASSVTKQTVTVGGLAGEMFVDSYGSERVNSPGVSKNDRRRQTVNCDVLVRCIKSRFEPRRRRIPSHDDDDEACDRTK